MSNGLAELEEEIVSATRSPHGYLVSPLSDNISETAEGYLIVIGCPIARTGFMKYNVADLPQRRAEELGVDLSNPNATIELYRAADDVFDPAFLASLNGKPITDNHPEGGVFVDAKNFNRLSMGHIQNVRKGTEPLEDGEWPIIADLIISGEPLIGKVKNKQVREISLGYDFSIDRDGDKIIQCNMLGNHAAIVPKGRAGDQVRIEDAAPAEVVNVNEEPQPASSSVETVIEKTAPSYPPIVVKFPTKEKQPVTAKKLLRLLTGKHLIEMARAQDADPEKFMEAVEEMHEPEHNNRSSAAEDKEGKDNEVITPPNTQKNEFKSADDKRKQMHDALDRALDAAEEEEPVADKKRGKDAKAKDAKAKDADIALLRDLLDSFLEEEEEEPEHADDVVEADPAALEAELAGADDDAECAECGMAADECICEEEPGEELVESGEEVLDEEPDEMGPEEEDHEPAKDGKATDRARASDAVRRVREGRATDRRDGAAAVLRMLRPIVARSNDKAVHNAFNKALDSVRKSSRASATSGGYGRFAKSASARDNVPAKHMARAADSEKGGKTDKNTSLQDFYNNAHKGGK